MSEALNLVSELEKKVGKNDLPKLMKVLTAPQSVAAITIFSAAKKKDDKAVVAGGRKLVSSMTKEQRPKLVEVLGEDLVKRLEAL